MTKDDDLERLARDPQLEALATGDEARLHALAAGDPIFAQAVDWLPMPPTKPPTLSDVEYTFESLVSAAGWGGGL